MASGKRLVRLYPDFLFPNALSSFLAMTDIISILSEAFKENKSVNYILKGGRNWDHQRAALMEYACSVARSKGKVYLHPSGSAAAVLVYPAQKEPFFAEVANSVKLVWNAVGLSKVKKVLAREKAVARKQRKSEKPIAYLWFIGVAPEQQGKGLGTELLQQILSEHEGFDMLLETSADSNIDWYQKNGFTVYDKHDFGYTLYFLVKPSQ